MNYLTEIKMFYDWLDTHELSAHGIALWHALMQMSSRSGWPDELEISIHKLIGRSSLSRSSVYKQRCILQRYGIIDFQKAGGSGTALYKITSFVSTTRTQTEILPSTTSTLPSTTCTQSTNTDKQNNEFVSTVVSTRKTQIEGDTSFNIKTKLNNKENNKRKSKVADESAPSPMNSQRKREKCSAEKEKKKASLFDSEKWLLTLDTQWQELMRQWLDYKQARRQTYKTEIGAAKCLAQLRTLAGNNIRTAQAIIDRSMANNWSGLFALQQSNGSRGQPDYNTPQHGQRIGQIMQTEDEAKRQRMIERLKNSGKKP